MRANRLFWAALLALALAACAARPPQVDLSDDVAAGIESVTIVRPPDASLVIENYGHPGIWLGGITGTTIASVDLQLKSDRFTAAMRGVKFSAADVLASLLAQKLAAAGYRVRIEDGYWERQEGRYALKLEKLPADSTALIVAPIILGYVSTIKEDYQPTITLASTLLGKERARIYRAYHSTGHRPSSGDWKHTASTRRFANFDALMADPAASALALNHAADLVTTSIVEDLRRPR